MSTTRLGDWVELRDEITRAGRLTQLVNRRDAVALNITAEADALLAGDVDGLAADLTTELVESRFLAGSAPLPTVGRLRKLSRALATLEYRFTAVDRFVTAVDRGLGRLLATRPAVGAQLVVALAGLAAVVHAIVVHPQLTYRVAPGDVPIVIAVSAIAIVVHELSHAVAMVRFGRRVDAIGVGLHLGSPVFFVEAVDGLLLTRRQRLIQAAAGPWAEWQITALVALALWANPGLPAAELLHRFVVINTVVVAANLLPFVGLDGYHLFSDLVRLPDLRERSVGAVGRVIAAGWPSGRSPGSTCCWPATGR